MAQVKPELRAGVNGYLHDYLGDGAYVALQPSGDVIVYAYNGFEIENRVIFGTHELAALRLWIDNLDTRVDEIRRPDEAGETEAPQ